MVVVVFVAVVGAYSYFVAPRQLILKTVTVHDAALSKVLGGVTAVFLSDLHLAKGEEEEVQTMLQMLDSLHPDIIFLAGDYVQWGDDPASYDKAFAFLNRLKAPLGVYAVMGDADYTISRKSCAFCHNKDFSAKARTNVTFLRNSGEMVKTDHGRLYVFGLDISVGTDSGAASQERKWIREKVPHDVPVIVLAHSSVSYKGLAADDDLLMLSGDTHGGQVLLPDFVWKLTKRKPDPDHMYGLFENGRKELYVTSGVGTSWPHIRLGVPPEIVVLKGQRERVKDD